MIVTNSNIIIVFWGGREGYMSLLNTNMKREVEHLAKFLSTARDYARKQGFKTAYLDFEEHDPAPEVFGEFDLYAGSMRELLDKMKAL